MYAGALSVAVLGVAQALKITSPTSQSFVVQKDPFLFEWITDAADSFEQFVIYYRTAHTTKLRLLHKVLKTNAGHHGGRVKLLGSMFEDGDLDYQLILRRFDQIESKTIVVAASEPFRVAKTRNPAHHFTGLTGKQIAAFAPPGIGMSGKDAQMPDRVAWATAATFVFDPKMAPSLSDVFSLPKPGTAKHEPPLRPPMKILPVSTSMRSITNVSMTVDNSDPTRAMTKNVNGPMSSSPASSLLKTAPQMPSTSSTPDFTKDTQLLPPPSLALDKFPVQKSQSPALRSAGIAAFHIQAITMVVLFVVTATRV